MATTVVEMSGDEAKLFRSLQKIINQQDKTSRGFEKVGRSARSAADKAVRAANDQRTSTAGLSTAVTRLAATYGTLSTAIGFARQGLQFMRDEADAAKTSVEALERSNKRLAQVATSREDLGQLLTRADTLAAEFGVSREQARDVLFTARSENLTAADTRTILRGAPAFDVAQSAGVAGQLPALFAGSGLTGSQAINLVATAAKESRADFEQIADAFARAAEGAGPAGASPAETGAVLSQLSALFSSPQSAAARIRAIGSRFANTEGFEGLGLVGGVRRLQSLSDEDRKEFLGQNQELLSAFDRISQSLDSIESLQGKIEQSVSLTGTAQSPVNQAVEARLFNERSGATARAQLDARRADVERELAREQFAQDAFERQAAIQRSLAGLDRDDVSGLQRFAGSGAAFAARSLQLSPEASAQTVEIGSLLFGGAIATGAKRAFREVFGGTADELERASGRLGGNINSEREMLRGVE